MNDLVGRGRAIGNEVCSLRSEGPGSEILGLLDGSMRVQQGIEAAGPWRRLCQKQVCPGKIGHVPDPGGVPYGSATRNGQRVEDACRPAAVILQGCEERSFVSFCNPGQQGQVQAQVILPAENPPEFPGQ